MEADEIERLLVRVEANAAQFEGQMKRINRALYGSAAETKKTLNQIKRDFDRAGREVGQSVIVPIQAASAIALAAVVGFSVNAAKRAEAVGGAFEQTFRDMPGEAQAAVTKVADEFGRLETDVKENFTQMRSVLTALGVDADQSLKIVDQLERRSLDIGAFANVSDADAFRAVMSGITGETEPLKKFGIVVNETATKAELLRLGFKGNATQASEAAKAIARANIILRQSAEMHGQVARESDQLAEQEKRTRAEFTKAAEDFGQKFLPVAKDVLVWATKALDAFNKLPEGTQNAALGMLALVAASGPIAAVIKGLSALIKAAVAARVALAAVGGSSAASGVAGGAAAGAAGGAVARAAPIAAVAAVTGGMLASFAPAPPPANAPVAERLAFARKHQSGAAGYIRALEAEQRAGQSLRSGLAAIAGPSVAGDAAAAAALAGLGDFGLSDAQQTAAGGKGGGKGGSGPSASDLANRREALSLERAMALAQASGSEKAVKAEEERQELIRLTADYQAAGYTDANAQALEHLSLLNAATIAAEERTKAEEQIDVILEGRRRQMEREADYQRLLNDQLMDTLDFQAQIASLSGDREAIEAAERRVWVESRINELISLRPGLNASERRSQAEGEADSLKAADQQGRIRDEFRSAFSEGIKAAIDGDMGGFFEGLADRFTSRMLDNLADDLFDLLASAAKGMGDGGGSGIGGFFSTILKGIPGFASGTPSAPGGLAYVHQGEVLANLKPGTSVIPAHAVRAMGALGGVNPGVSSTVQHVVFDNRGAMIWERALEEQRAYADQAAMRAGFAAVGSARSMIPAEQAQRQMYRMR